MNRITWRTVGMTLLVLTVLCWAAYGPLLSIPLIEDDYPNLSQAQVYGPISGLTVLFHDPVFRLRATSYWVMFFLWKTFHLSPLAFHSACLGLHVANTWLVYFVALAWGRMRLAAPWAAAFFAVHEGHQEAVMWFSAVNELLMCFFGLGAVLCWILASSRRRGWMLDLAGIALFGLALLSKESAVILLPLFVLTAQRTSWRRTLVRILPYCVLALVAVVSIAMTRHSSFRFSDGSFSLHAPFWLVWPRNVARILWVWGWISVVVLALSRRVDLRGTAMVAALWIGIALVPYCFLTYSTQIPSRQTYLASVGLALLFGLAVGCLEGRKLVALLMVLMVVHNIGYLWLKKRRQFLARAEPTEELIQTARERGGPIWVRCFPRPPLVAEEAVRLALGWQASDLVWSEAEASRRKAVVAFCYKER